MPSTDTTTKNGLVRLWDEIDSWDDRERLVELAEELADDEETVKKFGFEETDPDHEDGVPSYIEAGGGNPDDHEAESTWG